MLVTELETRLTVRAEEAAAMLGVSRRSVERMLRDGRLRRIGGGRRGLAVLIPVSDIRRLVADENAA
jgi:excisionase family DNA binding protein